MKKMWNWLKNSIAGNKLWFGIGLGALAIYVTSVTNKAFYYGLASIIVVFKLLSGKFLPKKYANPLILILCLVFLYTFVVEVLLKKDSGLGSVKNFFSNIWSKVTAYLPATSSQG